MVLIMCHSEFYSKSFICCTSVSEEGSKLLSSFIVGGGSRELLGATWCAPFGKGVSSAEFKLFISAVEAFCITFTAAKFLDLLGKC